MRGERVTRQALRIFRGHREPHLGKVEAESQQDKDNSRLWEHALHEDRQFYQQANFFLLVESLLVVAYSGLLAASGAGGTARAGGIHMLAAARIIAVFGLLLTVAWLYVAHRHLVYGRYVQAKTYDRLPGYRAIRDGRPRGVISPLTIIAYFIPVLTSALWTIFIFIT